RRPTGRGHRGGAEELAAVTFRVEAAAPAMPPRATRSRIERINAVATDSTPTETPPNDPHTLARWRLVLGRTAEEHGISCCGSGDAGRIEQLVGFLFEPGNGEGGGQAGRGRKGQGRGKSSDREGGSGDSQLTVPDWVDAVNELFPN